ncbi:hypothetical protein ES708_31974 [subsurface metagenome]
MKKIYTKVFAGYITMSGSNGLIEEASRSWLLQDDIEVIGAECLIVSSRPSENDGFSWAKVELSQTAVRDQDGCILEAMANEGWNTTPAGIMASNGHAVVSFPAGYAVPVKEEGYLFINFNGSAKSADISEYQYKVIVYYIKNK